MNRLFLVSIFLLIGFAIGIYYKEIWLKEKPNISWQYTLFIFVYCLFLVASSNSYQQLIDSRYLSPILIPLNLLLISWLTEISRILQGKISNNNHRLLLELLLVLFIAVPIVRTTNSVSTQVIHGQGYTSKTWRESETLKYYQDYTINCSIYSNGVDVISFYKGEHVASVPRKKSGALEVATIESLGMSGLLRKMYV